MLSYCQSRAGQRANALWPMQNLKDNTQHRHPPRRAVVTRIDPHPEHHVG